MRVKLIEEIFVSYYEAIFKYLKLAKKKKNKNQEQTKWMATKKTNFYII